MKIVIWNVMNGMGRPEQINLFKSLEPDLAILPELKEKNINALKPNDAVWITNNHENNSPKGLGLLSFNQTSLSPLSRIDARSVYGAVMRSYLDTDHNFIKQRILDYPVNSLLDSYI